MNYLKQINAFWNWRLLNELNSQCADLYLAILQFWNMNNRKNGFNIPNSTLFALCRISKSELDRRRNVLIQKELIRYKNGKKGLAGVYEIVQLYDQEIDIVPV